MNKFERILDTFKAAWENLDPELLLPILSKQITYYEDPNKAPLNGSEAVINQWKADLSVQSEAKVSYSILKSGVTSCIASWEASWLDAVTGVVRSEGVFYLEIDESGMLKKFRQWWI